MTSTKELKEEIDSLINRGELLYYALADAHGQLPKNFKDMLSKEKLDLPNFTSEYDIWYSEALRVIKQIIPDRLDDFIKQYKNEKRKDIDFLTYGISDYLIGLFVTRVGHSDVDGSAAMPKMNIQNSILKSAQKRFESSLFDIKEVLQADLFDSELGAASELCKKGFVRGAGAIAGVVLETHLGHICEQNNVKSRKKHPSISDFNDLLKGKDVIDTPKWRFIQHLADLRNLCDHKKDRDPKKGDVSELIEGVDKIIKTVH